MKHTVAAFLLLGIAVSAAQAGETQVAVAANFTEPASEIAKLFAEKTGHSARLSFGASGQFLTQIAQGAPADLFISADEEWMDWLAKRRPVEIRLTLGLAPELCGWCHGRGGL